MASRSSAPEIDIKAEYCPEAVIEWHRLTGLEDRKESLNRKDLALKAKQHLVFLKWKFWYVDKKGKWELRYTSPLNGKNYISLRKACESCIEDGGCSTMQASTTVQLPSTTISLSPKILKDFGEIDQSTLNEDSEVFSSIDLQKCDVTTISEDKGSSTPVQVPPTTIALSPLHLKKGSTDFGEIVRSTSIDDSEVFSSVSLQNCNVTPIFENGGSVIHSSTKEQPPSVTIPSTPLNLKKRSRDFGEIDRPTFNGVPEAFSSFSLQKCNVTTIPTSKVNEKHVSTSKSEVTNSLCPYKRQKVSNMSIMDKNLEGCDHNEKVPDVSILEDNKEGFEKRGEALKMSIREECAFVSLLIKNRVLVPGTNVFCRGSNNIVKIGSIVFDGIVCDCCHDHFNIIGFETHSGCIRNSPSISIMLEDGRSLLECQREAVNLNLQNQESFSY